MAGGVLEGQLDKQADLLPGVERLGGGAHPGSAWGLPAACSAALGKNTLVQQSEGLRDLWDGRHS